VLDEQHALTVEQADGDADTDHWHTGGDRPISPRSWEDRLSP
jgi:hypothetical protein